MVFKLQPDRNHEEEISGHADLNTLLNIYAHPQQEKVVAPAKDMSRIPA